jgi:hypothetical protein
MGMKIRLLILALLAISVAYAQSQQPNEIIVKAGQEIAPVQPTMWGIFFEDINLGADGGIYAELVKNRSFEFGKPPSLTVSPVENSITINGNKLPVVFAPNSLTIVKLLHRK